MKELDNWTKEELIAEIRRIKGTQKREEAFFPDDTSKGDIFQNLFMAYYNCSLDGKLINYNDEFCRILGLDTQVDHAGINLRDLLLDVNTKEANLDDLISSAELTNFVLSAKRANGDNIFIQLNARLLPTGKDNQKIVEGVFVDRTQQASAEEALKKSHEWFNNVLENMIQGVQILDIDLCYKYINKAAGRHFGIQSEKCAGKQIKDVLTEMEYNIFIDLIANAKINGKRTKSQIEHLNSDNSISWIDLSIQPIPDGILVHSIDITKNKQAEIKLLDSEEKYRILADNSIDCIWEVDTHLKLVYLSPSVYHLVGFTLREILNTSMWKHMPKEEFFKLSRLARKLLSKDTDIMLVETELYSRTGELLDVEIHGRVIVKNNKIVGLQGSIRDISRQKEIERSLLNSKRTLHFLVKHTPASVAMFDNEMKYIIASNRYLFDYKLNDRNLTGKSHYEVFPEITDRWKKIHRRCLNGESARNAKDKFVRQNGSIDWIRWEIRPWYDKDNNIGGIILFSEVITELVEAAERIKFERDRFQILSDTVPGIICSYRLAPDGTHSMPFSSASILNLYGYTSEELAIDFAPVMERFHPDDIEKVSRSIADSAIQMTPWKCEFRYEHPERGYIWIEGHSVPTLDSDGSIIWHGFIIDITQRKKNEISLREQQDLLNEVGKMAKIGGWEFNVDTYEGNYIEEVARIHELGDDDQMNVEQAIQFYVGESRTIIEEAVAAAINEARPYDLQLEFRGAKGGLKWVHTVGRPVTDGKKVVKIRGILHDITARKKIIDEFDRYRATLEEKVKERTLELEKRNSELNEKNQELRHFNELFINREFRIKELKERIKTLEEQVNKRHK